MKLAGYVLSLAIMASCRAVQLQGSKTAQIPAMVVPDTLTMKPGPLEAKYIPPPEKPAEEKKVVNKSARWFKREQHAAKGTTVLRNETPPKFNITETPIDFNVSNPTGTFFGFIEESSKLLSESEALLAEAQAPEKGPCDGPKCTLKGKWDARYGADRSKPQDWMAPAVLDVDPSDQTKLIPTLKNDISCCGSYHDKYDGNRIDTVAPFDKQYDQKYGVVHMQHHRSPNGTNKAGCRPCSPVGGDEFFLPEVKPDKTLRPEIVDDPPAILLKLEQHQNEINNLLLETAEHIKAFNEAQGQPNIIDEAGGEITRDILHGVKHRGAATKMKNANFHVMNMNNPRVHGTMDHVPELVDAIGSDDIKKCAGCQPNGPISPETRGCKGCVKQNRAPDFYTPEYRANPPQMAHIY